MDLSVKLWIGFSSTREPMLGSCEHLQIPWKLEYLSSSEQIESVSEKILLHGVCKSEGTPRKLATAMQLQFPRNVADLKQATGFQLSRRTQRKLLFD
jgi:hypothetical protein